ncbi:SCO2521 family protein [Actinocrinis sp.]|uniref:SCO2521 family protein n=1 Tax=Actinocrinis sp. TaxID=1920516 RepID=UPI002C2EA8FA|nr:SCO2521 family protein [Actinocrinis sp.]HXR74242.1 SCO2521 family protein [Actinocrinis sp.]
MRTQASPSYPAAPGDTAARVTVAVGEVRTGLLRHGASLTRDATARLLDLLPGEPVLESQRPIDHALSPDVVNGVDCNVLTSKGARVRAVGTLLTHAAVTGGRILQTSTFTRIDATGSQRRQPWSHYTAHPGRLETLGRADAGDLAAGFAGLTESPAGCLDVGAVCERLARRLQSSPLLDGRPPIKSQWTRTRWTALYVAENDDRKTPQANFELRHDNIRAISLLVPYELREAYRADAVLELVRDLALHDWVLTTLTQRIERIRSVSGDLTRSISELNPTVSNLLHLWMPAARVPPELEEVWEGFERRPGFSRQWDTSVGWVRDQLSLHTLQLLSSFERTAPPHRT